MHLQPLNEMAAKKICPKCGLSMAKNHYWYKGAWRCKRSNLEVADNIRNADKAAAEQAAKAQKPAPTKEPAPVKQEPEQRQRPTDISQVRVGDYVCFKYDIEQCGEVLKITRDWRGQRMFTVLAHHGEYVSDPIDGDTIQVAANDCWLE